MSDVRRKNLLKLISASGLRDNEFCRKLTKVSPSYLTQMKTGTRLIGEKKARQIERDLKKPPLWLDQDQNTISNDIKGLDKIDFDLVPLISWVQAGSWAEAIDIHALGEGEEMIPCSKPHSINTYALRVEGDSMTSSGSRSFPDGYKIIIDPELSAGNGDFVIAKINGDDAVTFKQLIIDGSRTYLKPLNSQFPMITDEFRVLGKVIQAVMDL